MGMCNASLIANTIKIVNKNTHEMKMTQRTEKNPQEPTLASCEIWYRNLEARSRCISLI